MKAPIRATRRWMHKQYRIVRQFLDPSWIPIKDKFARDMERSTGIALRWDEPNSR